MREPTPNTTERDRGLHLGLALLALVHAPLVMRAMAEAQRLLGAQYGVPVTDALGSLAALGFAAFVAWLALRRFDTRSGVFVWPRHWTRESWQAIAAFTAVEGASLAATLTPGTDGPDMFFAYWLSSYVVDGQLMVGWMVLTWSASSLAEELVYRVLLLRALEGYLDPRLALMLQALVFELAHVYGYGLPFNGVRIVYGLVYGYAFQVSRSVAVPTAMHITHNLIRGAVAWELA